MTKRNDMPVGFRAGKAFYNSAELDAFDTVATANQKIIKDAEAKALRVLDAFANLEKQRQLAEQQAQEAEGAQRRHELSMAEEEAFQASLSDLALKLYKQGAKIFLDEGEQAYQAWLAAMDPDVAAHFKSEVAKARHKVWPEAAE